MEVYEVSFCLYGFLQFLDKLQKKQKKKKKKAKPAGNVSTDVESSFLDDSSAVNESVSAPTGASTLENSHFAPNHVGNELKNDVVPPNPIIPSADSDLQNFIEQLDAIDTDQVHDHVGNWVQ